MAQTYLSAVVGMHFHPPAKAILENLPGGAELRLQREPDNAYDPYAIRVYARPGDCPDQEALATACQGFGHQVEDLPEEVWIGFCASKLPKKVDFEITLATALAGKIDDGQVATAVLGFSPSGAPQAVITLSDPA